MGLILKILKKTGLLRHLQLRLRKQYLGKTFIIDLDKGLGYENMILENDWLDELIHLIPFSREDYFIDVGVNLGQTLLKIKSSGFHYRYIGFEPNPACFSYVQKMIEINHFSDCNIVHKALFNTNSALSLELDYDYDSRASVIQNQRPGMLKKSIKIDAVIFDEHFYPEKIGIVKIDVEGAELEVIEGMQQSISAQRPVIICEILDSYSDKVLDFTSDRARFVFKILNDLNYIVFKINVSPETRCIVGLESLDEITIEQWSEDSAFHNDYIFIPSEKKDVIQSLKHLICSSLHSQ